MKKVLFLFFIFLLSPALSTAADLPAQAGKIDINTASLAQLDGLTGIGPKYAQAIIDGRPYSSVDDLLRVKGIGPVTLQRIKDQGVAYVQGQPQNVVSPAISQNIASVQNTTLEKIPATEPIGASNGQINTVSVASYPSGVFINEILPNPRGPDETDEWIELYNSNNFDVALSGWQIQDLEGTAETFVIPEKTEISPGGFLVFSRLATKIMLNNDADGLNLLSPDNKVANSVIFANAPLGQSYNKTENVWGWSTVLTPGAKNIIAVPQTKTARKDLPNIKKSDNSNGIEAGLANVSLPAQAGQNINKTGLNPWFLFLAALTITLILASVVLFIKFKLKNYVRT